MNKVEMSTLTKAYKPFDLVKLEDGSICMVKETSVNTCQESFDSQISYSVKVIHGDNTKTAWFNHTDFEYIGNITQILAECMTHPMGSNESWVKSLLNAGRN